MSEQHDDGGLVLEKSLRDEFARDCRAVWLYVIRPIVCMAAGIAPIGLLVAGIFVFHRHITASIYNVGDDVIMTEVVTRYPGWDGGTEVISKGHNIHGVVIWANGHNYKLSIAHAGRVQEVIATEERCLRRLTEVEAVQLAMARANVKVPPVSFYVGSERLAKP